LAFVNMRVFGFVWFLVLFLIFGGVLVVYICGFPVV